MKKTLLVAASLSLCGLGHAVGQEEDLVEQCYMMLADDGSELVAMENSVMELTEPGADIELDIPDGESLRAITCGRNALRLAENDYMMALWGIPLIVYTDDENGERKGILLSIQDDQFAVEVSQGSLTDEDRAALVESLEGFYAALENDNGE